MVDADADVHAPTAGRIGVGEACLLHQIVLHQVPFLVLEVQAHFLDGGLLPGLQAIGVHGEDATAREVGEDVFALQCRHAGAPIDVAAAHSETFVVVVLGDWVDEVRVIGLRQRKDAVAAATNAASGGEGALAQPPTVVAAGNAQVDLFDLPLADVGDEQTVAVPGKLLRVAKPVGPNLRRGAGDIDEGIVGGNAVGAVLVAAKGIDAGNRAEGRGQRLAVIAGIVGVAAVAKANVEQAEIRRLGVGVGIEGDGADVVVGGELPHAHHFAPCARELVCLGIGGGPLDEDAVLYCAFVLVVRNATVGSGAECRVELAVAGFANGGELRMEGEAHEARLVRKVGVGEGHVLIAQVQIDRRWAALAIGEIENAANVVERQSAAAGYGQQVLDARVGVVGATGLDRIVGLRSAYERFRDHSQVALLDGCRQWIVQRLLGARLLRYDRRQRRGENGREQLPKHRHQPAPSLTFSKRQTFSEVSGMSMSSTAKGRSASSTA